MAAWSRPPARRSPSCCKRSIWRIYPEEAPGRRPAVRVYFEAITPRRSRPTWQRGRRRRPRGGHVPHRARGPRALRCSRPSRASATGSEDHRAGGIDRVPAPRGGALGRDDPDHVDDVYGEGEPVVLQVSAAPRVGPLTVTLSQRETEVARSKSGRRDGGRRSRAMSPDPPARPTACSSPPCGTPRTSPWPSGSSFASRRIDAGDGHGRRRSVRARRLGRADRPHDRRARASPSARWWAWP